MALMMDELSLWELAHRWNNIDPVHSKTVDDIPLEVKDMLKNLGAEVYYEHLYTKWLLNREMDTVGKAYRRHWLFFWTKQWFYRCVSMFDAEFKNLIKNNEYDIPFLKRIMIPVWELEYWCNEYNVPFPDFWQRTLLFGGTKLPFPGAKEVEPYSESDNDSKNDNYDDQNLYQKAAYARHEPTNILKRECAKFSIQFPDKSNAEIARLFIRAHEEKVFSILKRTNAVNTLKQAMSEFKNNADKPWLKGFDPR